MSGVHPVSSEPEELAREVSGAAAEANGVATRRTNGVLPAVGGPATDAASDLTSSPRTDSATPFQPRTLIGLALIACGIGWALVRGLHYYGFSTMNVVYDLDQPPVLLILIG